MTTTRETLRMREVIRRQWIVVLAATLIAAVVAVGFAKSEAKTSWKATRTVVVITVPMGITSTAKGDLVVTAASVPSVLTAAERKLQLRPGALRGSVSSKLATADKSTAAITVIAKTKAEALARSEAVAEAAIDYVLAPYQEYFVVKKAAVVAATARADDLSGSIRKLEKLTAQASSANRWGYYQALLDAKRQQFDAQTAAREEQQSIDGIRASIHMVPEPTVGSTSSGGMRVPVVAQGFLLGLIFGVLIAVLREWLRARRLKASTAS